MTAEAGLRARVLLAVRQQWPRRTGVLLRGNPASAATGPGHPDIDGVVRSRPIALEIKKARGKPTPLQTLRLCDLRNAGCYAWIVRSPSEACDAVYWVAKGWTRPLSNEPLDLNAWLMGDPPKVEAGPFEPNAETANDGPAFNMTVQPEVWDTPEHQQAAAKVMGYESAEQRNLVDPLPSTGDALAEALGLINDYVQRVDADLRAVGDRVTLVYEKLDVYTSVLYGIDRKISQILSMIEDDPGIEDVAPGDDGTVSAEVIFGNGAEPTPTVPEPKRRRSRKPKEFVAADERQPNDPF